MKTINVHDLTWKTLQEMKLEGRKASLEQVINDLIIENCQLKKVMMDGKNLSEVNKP
jgi:predicted CopG family antitoxin